MDVGVIGLGNLGLPIATRLADRGHDVVGFDADPVRVDAAGELGRGELEEIRDREVILVVTSGLKGVAETLRRSVLGGSTQYVVVISTVSPVAIADFARAVASDTVHVIEAPVSGGADAAREGTLAFFLGGAEEEITGVTPVLDDLGHDRVRLGPIGSASAAKLANQLVLFTSATALAEGLRLAMRFGADPAEVRHALSLSLGDTWVGRNWSFFPRLVDAYNEAGTPRDSRPWNKDLADFVETAQAADVSVKLAPHIRDLAPDTIEHLDDIP